MIAPLSFLAAFDKPQAKRISGEAEAQENTENAGNDGFAALIAQLIQIIPTENGQDAEASLPADGQTGNPASGKILPVDGHDLAAATASQVVGEALASASPLPVSATLMNSSATIISFEQAQTALAAKQGGPIAQGATNADLPQAAAKEGLVAHATPRANQIRMTISIAPAETAVLRTAAPQDASAPVEKQLSAAIGSIPKAVPETGSAPLQPRLAGREDGVPRTDGPVAAALPTEPKQSGREPQAAAAMLPERTRSVRAASLEKDASSGERSGQSSAAESPAGAARALASSESAKPFAMPVIAAHETAPANRGEGMRMAAAAPTNALTSIDNIERLVERLSVAREFDMTKSASIAVTHREFGALTVTFDKARNGLDVEIAAKDNDMQRALALAVAADRPASRAGEPLQQSFQQTSQAASAGSERGAGSTGQGANSSGAGAEGDRSQNQRGRNLSSSPQDPRNPARSSPGDDALYA